MNFGERNSIYKIWWGTLYCESQLFSFYIMSCFSTHGTYCQLTFTMRLHWPEEGGQMWYICKPSRTFQWHLCVLCLCLLKFCPLPCIKHVLNKDSPSACILEWIGRWSQALPQKSPEQNTSNLQLSVYNKNAFVYVSPMVLYCLFP